MFGKIKAMLSGLGGAGPQGDEGGRIAAVEYNGYRIKPAPYRTNNHYQTAGSIEKDTPEGLKEHHFIRADTYASREDAIAFTVTKAKQIIDQQGDRIFT